MYARRAAAGFTLIETVVVLVILSLLFGTALTNMKGMLPAAATESAAQEVLAKLDMARTQAIARGHPYDVVFDLDEQRFAIRTPFDEDGAPATDPQARVMQGWTPMKDGTRLAGLLDATGQRRERGTWTVTFHPSGEATEFYAYVTHTADEEAYLVTVRLLGLTGLASQIVGEAAPPKLLENDF